MEIVPTSAFIKTGQIESFLEGIYSKAVDMLEAKMRRRACSSVHFVPVTSNTQSANVFLKEVSSMAICIFSYKLSKLISSGPSQYALLRDVYVRHTPPMACLNMHDGNNNSLWNTETQEDIQSRWPLTSDDKCFNKCEGSIKTQQMQQDTSGTPCPKVEAIQGFGKTIESPPALETNLRNEKDTEPMIVLSVSHPKSGVASSVDMNEPEMSDLKELTPQEAESTNICEFTGFHPARNLLQSGLCEKQVYPCAKKQSNSNTNEFALKSTVNVPSEISLDTICSESLECSLYEGLEDKLSGKFSQQAMSDGSVVGDEEGLEIRSEKLEECPTVVREMKTCKDQEVPDSHLVLQEEVEDASLFYSLGEIKDGDEVTLDAEQVSSCAEALGCQWFMSPTKGTPDMTSSKENLQKLPSIPACNRQRRVGLSRKQKVPPLHTKRLKLSNQ